MLDIDDAQAGAEVEHRLWWADPMIVVALGVFAYLCRQERPSDGFWFDDAWQAFGAVNGSVSNFLTVGQTQPGFGLVLIVWNRVFDHETASLITPALAAGVLGPMLLYLVL